MAPLVASDLHPALRRFLEAGELAKSLKAFDKETASEEPVKVSKKAKKLADMELVAAAQAWLDLRLQGKTVKDADVYPAVRRLLTESGLQKSLKAFDKETAPEDGEEPKANKKTKALAELELVDAAAAWLEAKAAANENGEAPAAAEEEAPKKKEKKRKAEEEAPAEAIEEAAEEEVAPKKKKQKKAVEAEAVEEPQEEAKAEEEEQEAQPKKKKEKKEKKQKVPGEYFSRIDVEKWTKAIQDDRLKDNTHKAKNKFGDSAGDSWADKAAEDMLKVKGKGFRKEMAKKKRASWRGGGEIDQGCNSIAFPSSSDEE